MFGLASRFASVPITAALRIASRLARLRLISTASLLRTAAAFIRFLGLPARLPVLLAFARIVARLISIGVAAFLTLLLAAALAVTFLPAAARPALLLIARLRFGFLILLPAALLL